MLALLVSANMCASVALSGAGCTVQIESPLDDVVPSATGVTPLRRLNKPELLHTLEDLLGGSFQGDWTEVASRVPADATVGGLDTIAQSLTTSSSWVQQIDGLVGFVAGQVDIDALTPCSSADVACLPGLFDGFARRALRRPMTADERSSYTALYTALRDPAVGDDHPAAMRALITRLLGTPDFLYQVALGDPATGKLTDHEMAARLSYLLWETMPDAQLAAAADRGELHAPAQVEAELARMTADPRTARTLERFASRWLHIDDLDRLVKDPDVYPGFEALKPALRESFERGLAQAIASGSLADLLTSRRAWVNTELAAFYGVPAPPGGGWAEVELPPERAGVLAQAPLLAIFGKANRSSPILRGVFVLDRLLCDPPAPPPPVANQVPPDLPTTTTREFVTNLTSPPGCIGCHARINPIGFAFEHFDGAGAWRDQENGNPIDATGSATIDGQTVAFSSHAELTGALAGSEVVRRCLVRRWFRARFGRIGDARDDVIVDALDQGFADANGQLRALAAALARTPALYRPRFDLAK